MEPRKSPVHRFAEAAGIPVLTPTSLKGEAEQRAFAAHRADVAVVVAYGLLLPKAVLDAPRLGCLNLHASALPRWRGAAPIQRAIMAGDTSTAMMIMRMEEGLDTGPVCLAEFVQISLETTAGMLHDELSLLGGDLIVRALAALERGSLSATPQSADGVTYAAKITKDEARIDFTRPAREVHDRIRGLSPHPGAWFEVGPDGKRERVKVLASALTEVTGDTRHRARRRADHCLRRGRHPPRRGAARGQEADVGVRVPARLRYAGRNPPRLSRRVAARSGVASGSTCSRRD